MEEVMYRYYIYGLGIRSEIKLYQLEQYTKEAKDVFIHYGKIEEDIAGYADKGANSAMSAERLWFRNELGHFVIKNGKEIMIQPAATAKETELAGFVLGWCIAFLFQQRGVTAIHCSALEMYNRAVLISGGSGAGKSTLTLSLLQKGYRYLADDIAMIDIKQDFLVQPAFPQQKVCRNVAEEMAPEQLFYVDEKKDKFAYINKEAFCNSPKKLSAIFLIRKYDGDSVQIEQVKGLAKWNGIMQNLFLWDAYQAFGFPKEEQDRCLMIAGNTEVYEIRRPKGKDTVDEICDKIMKLVQE